MFSVEIALIARKALLQMTNKPTLTCAGLFAVRARDWQIAVFLVLEQLGLTWKDTLAPIASEVVTVIMRF